MLSGRIVEVQAARRGEPEDDALAERCRRLETNLEELHRSVADAEGTARTAAQPLEVGKQEQVEGSDELRELMAVATTAQQTRPS